MQNEVTMRRVILLPFLCFFLQCAEKEPVDSELAPISFPQSILLEAPFSPHAPTRITASIATFNNFMKTAQLYLNTISQIDPTVDHNSYVWAIQLQGKQITVTGTRQQDDSIAWEVSVLDVGNGSEKQEPWIALKGTTTDSDVSPQEWIIFQENSTAILVRMSITKSSDGEVSATIEDVNMQLREEILNNVDHSGEYREFAGQVKIYEALWASDGSGYYTAWTEAGELSDEGRWE
jgi:hypothetical protein